MTHVFSSSEFWFLNLGLGYKHTDEELYKNFISLVDATESRKYMSNLMKKTDLKSGRKTVNRLIQNLMESK